MTRSGIFQVLTFFMYLLLQVLLLKNVMLGHTAFCFVYVAYLVLFPVDANPMLLLGIGFLMGFTVDIFYDSLGMHAMACVLVMYLRNYWLNFITPQGGYDVHVVPSVSMNGPRWFFVYVTPLVFLHHAVLFYIEAGGFELFWFTLWKIIASTFFTILVVMIIQFLFPQRRRL